MERWCAARARTIVRHWWTLSAGSRVSKPPPTASPVHGMLDPDIITSMLRAVDLDGARIQSAMQPIIEAAQDFYQDSVPDLRDKTCPGVVPLLDHLRERGTVLALVTGNLTRIGWRKLERAGLRDYFRFGAFGEMAPTRGGLARIAIEQARRNGLIDEASLISLIGDAVQDVAAARENGIRAIAVRTGITPPAELEASAPRICCSTISPNLMQLDLMQPALIQHLTPFIV